MKFACVVTKWIGEGTGDDKYRADMPEGYTRMSVLGNQYINLKLNCPNPNVAVVLVEESRMKHKGYISALKPKMNQVVMEEWQDGGQAVRVASAAKLRGFLVRQGIAEDLADDVADLPKDLNVTSALIMELEDLDKRSRRRIQVEQWTPEKQAEVEAYKRAERLEDQQTEV